jgi:bidirectional [NiFe] hydrogenase diaphorase subunit
MVIDDLIEIAEKERATRKKYVVRCCLAAGCMSSSSKAVKEGLEKAVKEAGLEDQVEVRGVGCMKLCCQGPLVQMDPGGPLYEKVTPEDAVALIQSLSRTLAEQPAKGAANVPVAAAGQLASAGQELRPEFAVAPGIQRGELNQPFFTDQLSIVLANSGYVDPERIESYITAEGYQALHDVLREMTPKDVVETIIKCGLRGRGGAGYPTGLKWATVAKTVNAQKYVICNADEGDPGAFMDRSVLESDPHSVLEGMAIGAYAVGANQGFIYVRAEYPLAISRLQIAIKQAKQHGLLGSGIFESPFNFNIDLRIGAGAFVCGEETALMASVEGKRGTPRPRPPFPAESGLWNCPTLINNVETFANVAPIMRKGADWFAGIGTEKSKGTKVFALAGKITNTGLIEVPMGTTLRQIVERMGGGAPNGGKIKAVQTGGPSGGCIPAEALDTPVDYDWLSKLGSIMGSGGMIVMDDSTRMVDVARFFMEFCMDESCGKCIPCRTGTAQMLHLLEKILARKATPRDLQNLEELCDMVRNTSLCGLGQTAPNPVMSTLRFFRKEYEELLIKDTYGPNGYGSVNHEIREIH